MKLKDIAGVMVEIQDCSRHELATNTPPGADSCINCFGISIAKHTIDAQGEVEINVNKKVMVKAVLKLWKKYDR